MENFESILSTTENTLNNIRGIFDKEKVEIKIKKLEEISQKKIFER